MTSIRYSTDLCDEKWALISPILPPARTGGRPRTTDLRQVVNAILYLVKTGCQWRNLPKDFPAWETVYTYFKAWRRRGIVKKIVCLLVPAVRKLENKEAPPSVAIIDSQSVKTGKMVSKHKGYDGGKRTKGRKRHIVVDVLGLPLAITITPANVHDSVGGKRAIERVGDWFGTKKIKKVYADGGYQGPKFKNLVKSALNAKVSISKGIGKAMQGFLPIKKRWVVERSFAWLCDYRRLDKDQERLAKNSRTMIQWAFINLMLGRLAV